MAVIAVEELPSPRPKALPKYPMPVAFVGRLAVDGRAQRKGFGERLLVDALERIADVADQLGCFGLVADAKDAGAQAFYARYGLTVIDGAADRFRRRMFLRM